MARFIRGRAESGLSWAHRGGAIPPMKLLGSNVGAEYRARISPEGFIAIRAPRVPARVWDHRLSTKTWSGRSIVVRIGRPRIGAREAEKTSSRTMRPRASTSVHRVIL